MFVCPLCASIYPTTDLCPRDGALPAGQNGDSLIGSSLGSYRIASKVGAGGMGAVYRAVQPDIGSVVAIKVLSHDSAREPEIVNRFFEEARSVNVIRHENIVNILDLALLPDGRPFIVMEFLDGASLKSVVRNGPMPVAEACRIAIAVLDALAAAHHRGVVHRDLKPDNIVLSPNGRVTLVDFGIAKIAAGMTATPRTATGVILGTPSYMSPEQAQGRGRYRYLRHGNFAL
jgi:eukaryotic-like serine/threonine-protein kinase